MKVFEDTEDADEAEAIKAVEKPSLFDLRVTSGVQVSELSYLQSALPLSVFWALRVIFEVKNVNQVRNQISSREGVGLSPQETMGTCQVCAYEVWIIIVRTSTYILFGLCLIDQAFFDHFYKTLREK